MARRKSKNKKASLFTVILVAVLCVFSFFAEQAGIWNDALDTVSGTHTDAEGILLDAYFIDVGQGDCSLFVSDGKAMLIDCGEKENADTVIQTISSLGIKKLDYAVVTHAHSDHMGAMADVINSITVDNILVSQPCDSSAATSTYEKFMDAADDSGADIILAEPDYTFTVGYAECTILAPSEVSSNENNNSIVMHISAGENSFLLTGDAETKVEKDIMKKYPGHTADIYKAGHHGSSTSSYRKFVEQLNPEVAVIQCGKDNSYGHPNTETTDTFNELNIAYYRSDICGNITISCTADDYTVKTENK